MASPGAIIITRALLLSTALLSTITTGDTSITSTFGRSNSIPSTSYVEIFSKAFSRRFPYAASGSGTPDLPLGSSPVPTAIETDTAAITRPKSNKIGYRLPRRMVGARIRITDNPQAENPQDFVEKRPTSASKDEPPTSKLTLPRPTPHAPLPPLMTLLGGPRRGYVPVRRQNPSGGLQSSRQISPSDGTRHRQLRGRDRQAEEEDGEAGMTEAGVTEAGQSKTSPELYYNGGPVIADPVVYLIYYGTWPENSGAAIIDNFVQSLGGNASRQGGPRGESSVSGWWAITTHYFMTRADRKLAYVTPKPSSANACFPSALPFLLPSAFLLRSAFPPPLCLPCSSCCRLHIKHQERLKSVADQPSSDNAPFSLRPAFPPPLSLSSSSCCRLRIKITTFSASPPAHVPSPLHFSPPFPPVVTIVFPHRLLPSSPPPSSSGLVDRNVGKANCLPPTDCSPRVSSARLRMRCLHSFPGLSSSPSLPLPHPPQPPVVDRNVGKANRLPSDPNGIYIVVTSADVDVWEFSRCSYCGWHAQMMDMRTGSPIAYAFVGHHSLCCQYSKTARSCSSSPNGLPASQPWTA
ncbi:unnamed protein product [Closterium sp. NIES-54]